MNNLENRPEEEISQETDGTESARPLPQEDSAEAKEAAASAESSESTVSAEPGEPTASAEPSESTAPVEPGESTASAEPSESTISAESSEPTASAEHKSFSFDIEPPEEGGIDLDALPEGVLEAEMIGEAMVLSASEIQKATKRKKKKKKKMKTAVKVALIVALVLLSLVLLLCGAAYGVFYHYYSMMEVEATETLGGDYRDILDALRRGEVVDLSGLTEEEKEMVQKWQELQQLQGNDENPEPSETDENVQQIIDKFQPVDSLDRNDNLINILLIGEDQEGSVSHLKRSDVMVLVTVNPYTKAIYMTSFLRDSYVMIPGIGWDKLNHSYAYGGASLTIATIEQTFGIAIDNYAAVDFEVFSDIIDTLDGVDLAVSNAELKALREKLPGKKLSTKNGVLHMDGETALTYCRLRSIDSDVERTARQRKLLGALVERAKQMEITDLMSLAAVIFPQVKTDMKQTECFELIAKAASFRSYEVVSQRIPMDDTYYSTTINKTFYWIVDFDANRNFWSQTAGKITK